MTRFLLPILMLAAVAMSGCGNSSSSPVPVESENPFATVKVGTDSTLEVMTWNLEHFAKNGAATSDMLIEALAGLEADIIGMQEIESGSRFREVVAGLEGWDGFRATSSYGEMNLAFIYRTDGPLQVESIQEIMTDDGRAFPRSPLLLLGSFDGQPIAVINNHLKCCGNGVIEEANPWDEETRRLVACQELKAYAEGNLAARAVFIIGDFNDEVTDAAPNNVFQDFLDSDWRILDLAIAEGPASGWSYPGWPSHLDHIIINFEPNDGLVRVPALAQQLRGGWSEYDQNISDHLPVVTRLRF